MRVNKISKNCKNSMRKRRRFDCSIAKWMIFNFFGPLTNNGLGKIPWCWIRCRAEEKAPLSTAK